MRTMALKGVCLIAVLACGSEAQTPVRSQEAQQKVNQCMETQGGDYLQARDWLIEHPEALQALRAQSWQGRWVKDICEAWLKHGAVFRKTAVGWETAEHHARGAVAVGIPDPRWQARLLVRQHAETLVPLMVEYMWKTGRNWRRYKAWRVLAVVEYLKMVGDPSVLGPAMEVLVSRSYGEEQAPDPGSEYPRMDPGMRAGGELVDQMAPYQGVQLIVALGDDGTLAELRRLAARAETPEGSKRVLRSTIKLLEARLGAEKQGLPVEEIGLLDLYVEFGDRTTLENMRAVWGKGRVFYGERIRQAMADLEKRLQEEENPGKTK